MKKINKFICDNMLIFFILGILLTTISVSGANYLLDSKEVSFSNANMQATNVQGAVDELYGAATDYTSIDTRLTNLETGLLNKVYPVGSLFLSTTLDTTTKVKNALGGTWEVYGAGRTIISAGSNGTTTYTAGGTGGSSSVTIAVGNLPSHNHSIPVLSGSAASTGSGYTITNTHSSRTTSSNGSHSHTGYGWAEVTDYSGSYKVFGAMLNGGEYSDVKTRAAGAHTHTVDDYYTSKITGVEAHTHTVSTTASNTGNKGSGTALSVQNPYIVVYMYKRTA